MGKFLFVYYKSRRDKNGHPFSIDLGDFCDHIKKHYSHIETAETASQYAKMTKEQRTEAKDRGGIVFAELKSGGGKKTKDNTLSKTAAVIDYDHQAAGSLARVEKEIEQMGVLAWIHTTHSHTAESECFRVVLPFSAPTTPDHGERVNKILADGLGCEYDPTTVQQARPFFTPSHSKGAPFYEKTFEGRPVDPSQFATATDGGSKERKGGHQGEQTKEDPREKGGIIGAFCRCYDIQSAIEEFLPDTYTPTKRPDRYTYAKGTTWGGLVIYGQHAYSNHSTDPIGDGHEYNSYDLVRVHKFGGDAVQMDKFAESLEGVKKELARMAAEDFAGMGEDLPEWLAKLERNKKGEIISNHYNIDLIFRNEPDLSGLYYDTFLNRICTPDGEPITDNLEKSIIVNVFGIRYRIDARQKIIDTMGSNMEERKRDSLKEYFDGLPEWDGVRRIERLLIDCFGCEDNAYYREIIKIHLVGAVARAVNVSNVVKYQTALALCGAQGVGKSTFIQILCPCEKWLNDSIYTINGKDGNEALQGKFFVELAELSALKKADVEHTKTYMGRGSDAYRPAYGRNLADFPRRCVFFATTNEIKFLRGLNGNRRFLVCMVKTTDYPTAQFKELESNKAQIWAEAKALYKSGYKFYLSDTDLNRYAEALQEEHNQDTEELEAMAENVRGYLEKRYPADFMNWEPERKKAFYRNPDPLSAESDELTEFSSQAIIYEIWGLRQGDKLHSYYAKRIPQIMKKYFPDWEPTDKVKTVIKGHFLRGYRKK